MERINRSDDIALFSSSLGKGEAVVLTGHRRAGKTLQPLLLRLFCPI